MALGLEVAILPGLAAARRLDSEGDWKRHLLLVLRARARGTWKPLKKIFVNFRYSLLIS